MACMAICVRSNDSSCPERHVMGNDRQGSPTINTIFFEDRLMQLYKAHKNRKINQSPVPYSFKTALCNYIQNL